MGKCINVKSYKVTKPRQNHKVSTINYEPQRVPIEVITDMGTQQTSRFR